MSTLSFLIPLLFNVPMLIGVGLVALAAVAIGLIEGWPRLILDALNWRYWVGIAAFLGIIAFVNAGQTINQLKQENVVVKEDNTAKGDSLAVITDLGKKKDGRHKQADQMQNAINQAPVGDQVDALMDEIAREQSPSDTGTQ